MSGNKIKSKQNTKGKMVRPAVQDAPEIMTALVAVDDDDETTFYPWNEYQSLQADQKRTVVIDQKQFQKKFNAFTLSYYREAVTITMMQKVLSMEDVNKETVHQAGGKNK